MREVTFTLNGRPTRLTVDDAAGCSGCCVTISA